MTTTIPLSTNKNKELLNRLMILEKFVELKSNECAYYRTKVHLMQMSSMHISRGKQTVDQQEDRNHTRSSSEEISHSSITSQSQSNNVNHRYRTSSVPLGPRKKSILKKNFDVSHSSIPFDPTKHVPVLSSIRKERKIAAHNQNHHEELSSNEQHLQSIVVHSKHTQCSEKEHHPIKTSSKSAHTTLIIRLPRRFVKSLVEQQNKSTIPKLKVHISSELLDKLLQTHHQTDKFTIQSQFGRISACFNPEDVHDRQQSTAMHARAEVQTPRETRRPVIRHTVRTRNDGSDRKQMITEKNLHRSSPKHRRKKRHVHKSSSSSPENIHSKRSSLTNVTQSIQTLPSSG